MIKKIIVSISLFLSLVSFAQEGTSSPYSFYGIGDVKFKGTLENRSMGGISFVPDSIHINLQNPAMLSNIKLTTFAIGGTFSPTQFKTNSQKEKAQKTTLDYLSVALPMNKFALGFGLLPYSSVGYNIRSLTNNSTRLNSFNGTGGVNKVYSTLSYKFSNQLSIGADINYNFGQVETKSITSEEVQYSTRELNTSNVSGLNFNIGLAHQAKINKKYSIFSGVTYSPESNLNLENTRNIAIVQYGALGQESVVDDIDVAVADTKLKMPSKLTIGVGFGELKKWVIGSEVTLQESSNFGNRFTDINNVTYENAIKFGIGGYYIPKYTSFTNYWHRVTYRGGFRYENTGLIVNNLSILDRAVTFGFGLPLSGTFSNVSIGFEFGKKGTTNAGLIEENYSNISVSFSFNDRWFQKRKYD